MTLGWKQVALAVVAFGFVAALLLAIGVMPLDAVYGLLRGSVFTQSGWNETLKNATPLVIAGLAVFVALRAGLFNIGAEGQLLVGALAATAVALNVSGWLGSALSVVAGTAAGALWAFPAGWIKAFRNGHEVITTIMLNNVAGALAVGLVAGPLRNQASSSTSTDIVSESQWLPHLYQDTRLNVSLAIPFAVLLVWGVAVWVRKTVAGFELCATGANAKAALTAGVEVKRVTVRAMCLSGGLAGLAGALQMLAYEHKFYVGFSSGFGFDALGVALLAGSSAWGVVPAALAFGALAKGATTLQATLDVPKGLSGVLMACVIVVFAAYRYRRVRSHE
jgi:simple sugar transport system permease protein